MTTPKFGMDATTEALYVMSLEGWFTESSGDSESPTGWFAWTEIRENELPEIGEAFEAEFATIEGLDLSSLVSGWILYEDSQGFVTAVEYPLSPYQGIGTAPRSDARDAFNALEAEYGAWLGDDERNYSDVWVCVDCYVAHHYGATEATVLANGETVVPTLDPLPDGAVNRWFVGESDTPSEREPLSLLTGELSDNTDSETGEGIHEFSRSSCDGCGSHLGGARYRLAVWGES